MRTSHYLLATLKETPTDTQTISHQYMLRAGMIRKLAAGIYSWLPLGFKVLQKVEQIVREEMNSAGAQELLLPAIHPAEVWQETDRWDNFNPPLLKFKDRQQRDFCYGPTHEEVITDLMRNELKSYKQLPVIVYQIQHKFRDELRPRAGVMRAREFLMKDAYSFNADKASLQDSYDKMYTAYSNIFNRLGLNFRAVLADTGSIGGTASHEFQILAASGEDTIAISDSSNYAANVEKAEAIAPTGERPKAKQAMQKISTPNIKTIDEVSQFLQCSPKQTIKTIIVQGEHNPLVALVLRGDHELNEVKAAKLAEVAEPLTFATAQQVETALGTAIGFIGPVNLGLPIIIDHSAAHLADFICGANEKDMHLTGVNWERDLPLGKIADLRNVVAGDPSPDGQGTLQLVRGIEAGHIFQLGDKYSKAMRATFLDEAGKQQIIEMGCYGLGVSRLVAATIEQNHDDNGIIWPEPMAPFQIAIAPLNYHKSAEVKAFADKLYADLQQQGLEVLLDDRNERAGVMFADLDLIGIPHRIVISDRGLAAKTVEYKNRRSGVVEHIDIAEIQQRFLTN